MAKVLIESDSIEDVEEAVKEHGAENVYWYADSTRRKELISVGVARSHLVSKQRVDVKEARKLYGSSPKSSPKSKSTKKDKKDDEKGEPITL